MPKVPTAPKPSKKNRAKSPETKRRPAAKSAENTKAKSPDSSSAGKREVLYPDIDVRVCTDESAITADAAKALLGWWEEPSKGDFKDEYALKDREGRKIRFTNNVTNRWIYPNVVETLKQEILRKRWRFNGEPVIIGSTGLVLNGQHTLIGLILAAQEYRAEPEKWGEFWDREPVIDKLIVLGVDEGDATVNTMDTCKPRSLTDVIYRSQYFSTLVAKDRLAASRTCDYSIRLLWHRTGAMLDAYSPRRTHAEALDFLDRHPRILEAVQHVLDENDGKKLSRYLAAGGMVGMLYLMGSSGSIRSHYLSGGRKEEALDWGNWEKACEFVVLLAAGGSEVALLREAITALAEDTGGSFAERCALIANAWVAFVEGKTITAARLKLEYVTSEDGVRKLAEIPAVGGIDLGDPVEAEIDTEEIPSEQEVEERKRKVRAERNSSGEEDRE